MLSLGDSASLTRTVTEEDIRKFADASGDFNPIHLDPDFAAGTRFKRPIAHGMLAASLISAVLGTKLPGPGSIYLGQTLKFLKPVFPGDTLMAKVEVIGIVEGKRRVSLKTECFNQNNECVLEGEATLLV